MTLGGDQLQETRVRLVAQPASVPAVRRMVDDVLVSWGHDVLREDVGLSVTELATNATLHAGSSFFDVELSSRGEGVHVAVSDGGAVPGASIAARLGRPRHLPAPVEPRTGPVDELTDLESMTGRGLFIVSSLASRWGIDDLPDGTRIWADFDVAEPEDPAGPDAETPTEPVLGTRAVGMANEPSDQHTVIRLLDCPARALLAHDDNLADYARELALFGASHDDPEAVKAAEQVVEVVRNAALTWDAARLTATQAVQDGRERVDVAFAVTERHLVAARVGVLRRVVGIAEEMSRAGRLMTMPAPDEVQRWRDWVEAEMVEQATTGREPRPYRDRP